MTQSNMSYHARRDDTASVTRMLVTLALIVCAVAIVGGAVFAFAGALVGPAAPTVESAPIAAQVVEPPIVTAGKVTDAEAAATLGAAAETVKAAPVASASSVKKTAAPTVPAPEAPLASTAAGAAAVHATPGKQFVVVIDAGHQGKGNNKPEPIGPGSKTTKPAVADGAAGSVTRRRESVVNLEVSKRIQKKLQAAGVKVIMIRTSERVNITNAQRAQIANKAGADLLLRIHCDDIPNNRKLNGLLTMIPAKNKWTGPIVVKSAKAGKAVQTATLKTTRAKNRGLMLTSNMSGFNWSKVPAIIVEMGMMSNAAEDRRLSTPVYQEKLATGITNGVVAYLNASR